MAIEVYDCWICTDCLLVTANGEYLEDEEKAAAICASEERLYPANIVAGDADKDDEFSRSPCDLCGDRLAGARHHAHEIHPACAGS